jgi:Zn-dependent protease with chaperone function
VSIFAAVPPLLAALLFLAARPLGLGIPPAAGVRMLTALGLAVAVGCGVVLASAGWVALALTRPLAERGRWPLAGVGAHEAAVELAGLTAGILSAALLGCAIWATGRTIVELIRVHRNLAPGRVAPGNLTVVEDDAAVAYALAGPRRRIVLSTGMVRALTPAERRAVLAHEQAHLDHRHHWYIFLADVSAAANPLLRPLSAAIRQGVERWADEVAAAEVGDRRLVARSLVRATLAAGNLSPVHGALAVADRPTERRVRSLLATEPAPRPLAGLAVALAILSCLAAAGVTAIQGHDRVETVELVYQQSGR